MTIDIRGLQLLTDASVELTSILDPDRLLGRIAEKIRQFIEYDFFAILLIDGRTGQFIRRTAVGFSAESLEGIGRLSIQQGLVGRAARTKAPVLVGDVEVDPDYWPISAPDGRGPRSEIVLPLIVKERIIGVMALADKRLNHYREEHLVLLRPLAAQIAVSIENAGLYEEKSRDALTQQVMNEVGKEMTAILELEELLARVAVLMRRAIEYEILGIFLYRADRKAMELKVAIGYADETVERWRLLPLGKGLLGHAVQARETIVSTDLANDPRAISARTVDGRWTLSEVAIPLISRDRLLGGMVVESCDPRYFTPERVQILETLASQIAVSIDNAQLFQELLNKEQRLEADFALARDLQKSMLPPSRPQVKGMEFAALFRPAQSLGGDYYDFLWLADNLLALAIADVSGKGVAAAITMGAVRSALRFAARLETSPAQVLYHVNRRLVRDVKKRTYVTLFYCVLDCSTRILRWSNGGHYPPILFRADGRIEELARGGLPVALFDKSRYAAGRARLERGDLVFFYTDGVVEAVSAEGEEFGRDRLREYVRARTRLPARSILRGLLGEVKKFSRGMEQGDDITAFLFKVEEGGR